MSSFTCVLCVSWLEEAFHLTVTIWAPKVHRGVHGGATAFMVEAENCILCSLPFGLPILGQVFLLLFVSVF